MGDIWEKEEKKRNVSPLINGTIYYLVELGLTGRLKCWTKETKKKFTAIWGVGVWRESEEKLNGGKMERKGENGVIEGYRM